MGKDEGQITAQAARNEEVAKPSVSVTDLYIQSHVFVTGATGFIGKALVEKLLRCCPGVDTIYVLIRPKAGVDVKRRYQKLLDSSVFERVRKESPCLLDKLQPITGDVSLPALGMSSEDRLRLVQTVDIVFHAAATVRFNESLKDALELNTLGTIRVLDLVKEIKHLKSFIHVSTAYSNADKSVIEERVYPPPASLEEVVEACEEQDEGRRRMLQGGHPNTYTMTKAMAEWIIQQETAGMPVGIVRPSIVTGAWLDPVPGWVDNFSGISGIMVEIGRGTLKSIICDERLVMDVIPVDIVVNTLIAAAWEVSVSRFPVVRVYNCTSGGQNPILWKNYGRLTYKHCLRTPSRYVQWYPGFAFRTNRVMHGVVELFLQFLPALLIDTLMFLQGMKPIMLKIARKFKKACLNGEYFALHEWDFKCANMIHLHKITREAGKDFPVNVANVEWDGYVKNYVMGLRKYALNDGDETLEKSRRKLNRLYWGMKIFQGIALYFLFSWLYSFVFNTT